jgi:hypothetical protein
MVVSKESHTRLPFVEKYRPKLLEELASHEEIISTSKFNLFGRYSLFDLVTKMADERKIPHFLFYG